MPIHDWTRVDAGLFHAFHQSWSVRIQDALNAGVLPKGYYALVVVGVLNTAVSAYYYLRLIIVMFFKERTTAWTAPKIPASLAFALILTVVGVLYLGMFPGRVLNALQTRIETQLFTTLSNTPNK